MTLASSPYFEFSFQTNMNENSLHRNAPLILCFESSLLPRDWDQIFPVLVLRYTKMSSFVMLGNKNRIDRLC